MFKGYFLHSYFFYIVLRTSVLKLRTGTERLEGFYTGIFTDLALWFSNITFEFLVFCLYYALNKQNKLYRESSVFNMSQNKSINFNLALSVIQISSQKHIDSFYS